MDILTKVRRLAERYPYPELNQFQHIVKKIDLYWGEEEFAPYLSSLLIQDSHRRGFPSQIVRELDLIHDIHCEEFPMLNLGIQLTPFVVE